MVAIIAVLVAISIPVFSAQLHKARVATDWANIRSYFSEIQADYISTGKYNPNVPNSHNQPNPFFTTLDFLDGQQVNLKAGYYIITENSSYNSGYQIIYYCNNGDSSCELYLNVN